MKRQKPCWQRQLSRRRGVGPRRPGSPSACPRRYPDEWSAVGAVHSSECTRGPSAGRRGRSVVGTRQVGSFERGADPNSGRRGRPGGVRAASGWWPDRAGRPGRPLFGGVEGPAAGQESARRTAAGAGRRCEQVRSESNGSGAHPCFPQERVGFPRPQGARGRVIQRFLHRWIAATLFRAGQPPVDLCTTVIHSLWRTEGPSAAPRSYPPAVHRIGWVIPRLSTALSTVRQHQLPCQPWV